VATCSDRNGGIKNLLVAAHGRYVTLDNYAGEATGHVKGAVGGFGISLGTGIFWSNVGLMTALRGKVSNIYLYTCGGSAETPPNLEFAAGMMSVNPDIRPITGSSAWTWQPGPKQTSMPLQINKPFLRQMLSFVILTSVRGKGRYKSSLPTEM